MVRQIRRVAFVAVILICGITTTYAGVATFDDLPTPGATNSSVGLFYANGNSSTYQGVVWDSRLSVVGDQYRIDTGTPGPVYGLPHSGHYFLTNAGVSNDQILLSTNQLLTGAWFGQNAYYGFSNGADQVTIFALHNSTVLGSVVFDLPAPSVAGQPGVMGFADTSSFSLLHGITGYRIDRRATGPFSDNWVADNFQFVVVVPEPGAIGILGTGFAALVAMRRRRRTERK